MSYNHYFYAVDLDRLQQLFGSADSKFVAKLLSDRKTDNASFVAVVESIISGKIDSTIEPGGYGYVLKEICEYIGESIGDDVADVRDHPYESLLAASGPPIPIPYEAKNFPQIGFLSAREIVEEIERIDSASKPT